MVWTEDKIKKMYNEKNFEEFYLKQGDILTPSSRQFLNDRGVKIIKNDSLANKTQNSEKLTLNCEKSADNSSEENKTKIKYKGLSGELYAEKPEHMTQIFNNILVKKDDKRIIFRGKLDTFKAKVLCLQKDFLKYNSKKLNDDMLSLSLFLKKMIISEILDNEFEEIEVLGMTLDKIKEVSHNPIKYFGRGHLFDISVQNNEIVLCLNELRALSREVEIYGISCFVDEKGTLEKPAFLKALNRLSSVIYVMMLKGDKGEY